MLQPLVACAQLAWAVKRGEGKDEGPYKRTPRKLLHLYAC
jgi:hypothetical protein